MTLLKKFAGSGKKFPAISPGTYPARIAQIIDLGVQEDTYEGETKENPKLWVTFELPTETINIDGEDKPRWISREFTKSTSERALLTKLIMVVNEDAESLDDLLGKALFLETGLTSGGNAKCTGYAKPMKGFTVPELSKEAELFDLDNPNQAVYDKLPDFLKEKIDNRILEESEEPIVEGDVPF